MICETFLFFIFFKDKGSWECYKWTWFVLVKQSSLSSLSHNFSVVARVQTKVSISKKGQGWGSPANPRSVSFCSVSEQKAHLLPFPLVVLAYHNIPLSVHQIYISKFLYCCHTLIINLSPVPSVEAFWTLISLSILRKVSFHHDSFLVSIFLFSHYEKSTRSIAR